MAEVSEQQDQYQNETKPVRRSQSGLWFGIIILFIVLALAGAGFYFFTQLRGKPYRTASFKE